MEYFMNGKTVKQMMIALGLINILLLGNKAEAAELSGVISAGVTTAMEQIEDEAVLAAAVSPSVVDGYTLLGIVDAESGYINVREQATTDSQIVGKIRKDAVCEVVSIGEEWCEITSGEVSGYISREYLLTGAKANERAESLQEEGTELETALTLTEYRYGKGVSDVQIEICEYARQFVGNPYRWGGTSLTKGADCSGFTMSVYAKFGISLPHSSKAQANCGERVELSQVQPGDLIFYGGRSIHHVAMYIGNGQVVHAQSTKTGIVITSMYYQTPSRAVTILR